MAGKPTRYAVLLTDGAEQDLAAIYDYIADYDSPANAEALLERLLALADTLAQFPERGSYPKALLALGIKAYRQVAFKPYQLIYRVIERQVIVYLIVDSRRDLQSVLARRLLGA